MGETVSKSDDAKAARAARSMGKPGATGEELGEAMEVIERAAGVGSGYPNPVVQDPPAETPAKD